MKYRVILQHYDIKPESIVYKVGESKAETEMYGVPYILVTEVEGDTSEGMIRVIPEHKLERM